jgi:hypothetical protein
MTKPIVRIVNAETGEVVDREMNEVEFEAYEADRAAIAAAEAEATAKAAAKDAILAKLGITAEEAALLLG